MAMTDKNPGNVTGLLRDLRKGRPGAEDALWPIVYGELKKLAHHILRQKSPGAPLQTTALVHEAYLRLIGTDELAWNDRGHFFAIAARAMRFILVDHARRKHAAKHGGGATPIPIEDVLGLATDVDVDLVALDDALKDLKSFDPRQSQIVELAYFGGLTYDEIALSFEISAATVKRELRIAKMWLLRELRREERA